MPRFVHWRLSSNELIQQYWKEKSKLGAASKRCHAVDFIVLLASVISLSPASTTPVDGTAEPLARSPRLTQVKNSSRARDMTTLPACSREGSKARWVKERSRCHIVEDAQSLVREGRRSDRRQCSRFVLRNAGIHFCAPDVDRSRYLTPAPRDIVRWAAGPCVVSDDAHRQPSTALLRLRDQLDDVGCPRALALLECMVQGVCVGLAPRSTESEGDRALRRSLSPAEFRRPCSWTTVSRRGCSFVRARWSRRENLNKRQTASSQHVDQCRSRWVFVNTTCQRSHGSRHLTT